ncbi:MAG: hypothetical protein R3F55_23585 [Alphaproteobacteria bacterium]
MLHIDYSGLNATPAMIVKFLEDNVVMPTAEINVARNPGQPEYLEFREVDFPKGRMGGTASATDCRVLALGRSAHSDPNKALLSYVCEYSEGAARFVALGKGAGFCFTCTMNGCTFGIGSKAPDGTVLVAHANAKGQFSGAVDAFEKRVGRGISQVERSELQSAHQVSMLTGAYASLGFQGSVGFLDPGAYRGGGVCNATTVGYRCGNEWNFAFQSLRTSSGVTSIVGVFPVVTNAVRIG